MLPSTPFVRVAVAGTRIFLGILFFTAGMGKLLKGFPGLMGPPWLEEVLAKYDLALFAQFIAYSQVLTGLLLLTRFATLGAVMLFPMLLNILAVTISQNWRGTPYVVSVFLLMNIFLLLYDYHKLKFLISDDSAPIRKEPLVRRNPLIDVCWAAGAVILFAGLPFAKSNPDVTWVMFWLSAVVFAGCGIGQMIGNRRAKMAASALQTIAAQQD